MGTPAALFASDETNAEVAAIMAPIQEAWKVLLPSDSVICFNDTQLRYTAMNMLNSWMLRPSTDAQIHPGEQKVTNS